MFSETSNSLVSSASGSEDSDSSEDLSDTPPPSKLPTVNHRPPVKNLPTVVVSNEAKANESSVEQDRLTAETKKDAKMHDDPWDRYVSTIQCIFKL